MAEVQEPQQEFDIQEKLGDAEDFLNKNKKSLGIIVGAIVLAIVGYLLYQKVYVAGKEAEASTQMFIAEDAFRKDSLRLAIEGDKVNPGFKTIADPAWLADHPQMGFESIIDEYGVSPSGNVAHFYLGMTYLKKGEYDKAIDALKSYSAKDAITGSMALGGIGDAYMEQNNTGDAIKYYEKATKEVPNNFTTPVFLNKLAMANETSGNYKDAIDAYDRLIKEYPETQEGRSAIKYKARAEALANK